MLFFYNLGIRLYTVLIHIAGLKSFKAKAFIKGRENIFEWIEKEVKTDRQCIWFHFASLGEFEQGRPVLEKMKQDEPGSPILITFFSPSGYEIRKNYPLADHVFYLPVDTKKNAGKFISLINPSMAIFTKYEYWFHYFNQLKNRQIPLYIISGIFRKSQPFFRWYGGLHRKMLSCVSYFFVQNEESRVLLHELNFKNVAVSGDTRFDRVMQNANSVQNLETVKAFCSSSKIFIAGSTWPQDEKLIAQLIPQMPDWKFIIAPHEISKVKLAALETMLEGKSIRYSEFIKDSIPEKIAHSTLIINNIGMLSSLYQYGHIAYIGGGFGAGIHNTLEAAAFGLPVIFGSNYQKFKEAKDLIDLGAAFSINNFKELNFKAVKLQDGNYRLKCGKKAKEYIKANTGATDMILKYILSEKD